MLRWKPESSQCGTRVEMHALACVCFVDRRRERCAIATGIFRCSIPRGANFSILGFLILCAVALVGLSPGAVCAQPSQNIQISQDQPSEAEKASYADALSYCWKQTFDEHKAFDEYKVVLRDDNEVLCFDDAGRPPSQADYSLANLLAARDLKRGGLFVVRSYGIATNASVANGPALADSLRAKEATVVINHFCLGICADYFSIASFKTFVPKGSLVAWTNQIRRPGDCLLDFKTGTDDADAPHFLSAPCDAPSRLPAPELPEFYKERVFPQTFMEPPESTTIRRILLRQYADMGRSTDNFYWTWNPRFYADAIKTKIFYEAYPRNQGEVNAIASEIGLRGRVIYDP
jgi:hypothetical protein